MDHFTNSSSSTTCSLPSSRDRGVLVEVVEMVANEGELEDGGEEGGNGADAEAKLMAHVCYGGAARCVLRRRTTTEDGVGLPGRREIES
jgi:hypothetical protein